MTVITGHRARTTAKAHRIAPDELTVPVSADIFRDHPEATYLIGVSAVPGMVVSPELHAAAARLRHNVYLKEKGLMHRSFTPRGILRHIRGREQDTDDSRSLGLVVVENQGLGKPARLRACARMIIKESEKAPLPVEALFPEAFENGSAPVGGIEASRFIARDDNRMRQHTAARGLIRAMTMFSAVEAKQPIYAIVDRLLLGAFRADNIPCTELAPARILPEYNTPTYRLPNGPIAINTRELLTDMTAADARPDLHALYEGAGEHQGLGYFGEDMLPLPTE